VGSNLSLFVLYASNREREERLKKADLQTNVACANRLLGQGASITYEDVCECIKVKTNGDMDTLHVV
jgi:hypothetical protein